MGELSTTASIKVWDALQMGIQRGNLAILSLTKL